MKGAIDYVAKNGIERKVWGGTIPKDIKDKNSPNDFDRVMLECVPLTMKLTNPLARWCDWSDHWVGITLRETEDHLQGYNPGHVTKYSNLYKRWVLDNGYFNYTYGERFQYYPYNKDEKSGKERNLFFCYNQFEDVIKLLKEHPTTRRACMSTWFPPVDVGDPYCPCNMVMQLRIVNGKLDWITVVRSLDVLRGLSENIFMFTIWQEYAAWLLKTEIGDYYTVALNAHHYKDQLDDGYHKQKVPDPYEFYVPKKAFITDFPKARLMVVDELLFKGEIRNALKYAEELPQYWRNWKYALIAEWLRLKRKRGQAYHIASKIDNEFKFSIARRLNKYGYEVGLPDGQRKFLEGLSG
jgi:thymidylate synthase